MRDRCPSEERLSALLDGAVASITAQRLHTHLRACASCRERHEGLRTVRDSLRSLPLRQVPPEVLENAAAAGDRAEAQRAHRVQAGVIAAVLTAAVVSGAVVEQYVVGEPGGVAPMDRVEARQAPVEELELLRAAGAGSAGASRTALRPHDARRYAPRTVDPVEIEEFEPEPERLGARER